jgi:hypothetical protein
VCIATCYCLVDPGFEPWWGHKGAFVLCSGSGIYPVCSAMATAALSRG